MSERTFQGICIGGPRDGESIIGRDRLLECMSMPRLPMQPFGKLPPAEKVAVEKFTYAWRPLPDMQHDNVGVWWPAEDDFSMAKLHRRLFAGYRRVDVN